MSKFGFVGILLSKFFFLFLLAIELGRTLSLDFQQGKEEGGEEEEEEEGRKRNSSPGGGFKMRQPPPPSSPESESPRSLRPLGISRPSLHFLFQLDGRREAGSISRRKGGRRRARLL